jgi:hypothetical protein
MLSILLSGSFWHLAHVDIALEAIKFIAMACVMSLACWQVTPVDQAVWAFCGGKGGARSAGDTQQNAHTT